MCHRATWASSSDERGAALVATLMVMSLLAMLAATVVLSTITETAIAGSYREAGEMFYAAESAVEYVVAELRVSPDWRDAVTGKTPSAFRDGPAMGLRIVGSSVIDLTRATADLNAARPTGTAAYTPYAYGNLADLSISPDQQRPAYLIVWIADRSVTGSADTVLALFGQAYGPAGSRRAVERIVARPRSNGAGSLRVTGWSEVR